MSSNPPILLVVPPLGFEATYPLGMASLAARLLAAGEAVEGLDLRRDPGALAARLARGPRPGLLVVDTSIRNLANVRALLAEVRRRSDAPIAVIGVAAGLHPDRFLGPQGADLAVTGDPEAVIPALLAHLRDRAPAPDPRARVPASDLPEPDRTVFPVPAYGVSRNHPGRVSAALETTRGCTLGCTFCPVPDRWGRTCRVRPPEAVLAGMERLRRDHGVNAFDFEDEQPLLDRAAFETLLAGIRRRLPGVELSFPNGLRPDLLDRDLVGALAAAGARRVALGIESPSPALRERIGRPVEEAHLDAVLAELRRRGVVTTGYFLAGLPEAGPREPLALLAALPDARFDYVHVSVCWPWRTLVDAPTPAMRRAAALRSVAYVEAYGDPRRALRLARAGHLSWRRLPWVLSRLGTWIGAGSRGGGGW